MIDVPGAIASAFTWTLPAANSAVALVLGAISGQIFRVLFSLVDQRNRKEERKRQLAELKALREQVEKIPALITAAVMRA